MMMMKRKMNNPSTRNKSKTPKNVCSSRQNMKSILKHRESSIDRSYSFSHLSDRMMGVCGDLEIPPRRTPLKLNQTYKNMKTKIIVPCPFTRSYYIFTLY